MNIYSFIPFSSFLVNAILASVVFALNPQSRTNRDYSLFACCFAFWAFVNFLEWNFRDIGSLRVFAHLEPVCWLSAAFLVVNFIYSLIKRPRDWLFWTFAAIVAVWSALSAMTGCLVDGFKQTYWGVMIITTNLYLPAILMAVLLPAFFGSYLLIKTTKTSQDKNVRAQLRYLTIGMLLMFVVVFSDSFVRIALLRNGSFPFMGSFFLIIQSGFVFFAIVRYRFLNVDVRDAAREIFSNVNEGVILLDPYQGISDINGPAQDFFGVSRESKNMPLDQLFGRGYRFDDNCNNREISLTRDGRTRIGLFSQTDLTDKGRFIGKLAIIHDVTQHREDERKRALLEFEVQQSHASRLEALGMLAGGIAHDFNNLLSAVTGYATMLRMGLETVDEKLKSYSESIIKAAQRASDLTKKLLTFARRTVSATTVFDLHATIMETVSLLSHTIDKRVSIATDLKALNFLLKGDRAEVQNLLLNMAINAADAMPAGGQLVFKTRNAEVPPSDARRFSMEAEGGSYIVVDVADTGTGMTEEVKKKIFDPFFTTKQPGKGTGLGLASAYGIARSHKGFITVDTALGKGTVFHTFFPALADDASEKQETKYSLLRGEGRIMLVDDEESVRVSAAEMLGAIGYTVTAFGSGEEAVQWYREHNGRADLALLDVMMPGMTGDQCAEALQAVNPRVKILFISGYPRTISAEKIEALSAAGGRPVEMVQKPFTIEQLSIKVKKAICG